MVDVIMPVWSTDDETISLTRSAVDSLRVVPVKLIIIDNGSTVGGGALREMADLYIRNKENLGYAKAVNQGLKLSGKIVAVSNNDIRVPTNWWKVSKSVLNEGADSVHFRMIPYNQAFNPGMITWIQGKERWCSSSFFIMKNKGLYYDENFLNSYDDWDFWRTFREKGYLTAYTNRAEYQHMDSYTQEKIGPREENDRKNQDYYKSKWKELPEEWLVRMYPEQINEPWKPFP